MGLRQGVKAVTNAMQVERKWVKAILLLRGGGRVGGGSVGLSIVL